MPAALFMFFHARWTRAFACTGVCMTAEWAEGYFTDVSYTYGYYRELSPVLLRFCLLTRGVLPPVAGPDGLACCELGFGQGLSLNIHAASIPSVFSGTDFNPEHAAFAGNLARAAGLPMHIHDDSFEDFARRDLPKFDYIGLHGIWSWISAENRAHVVDFVRDHLKVGGVFYLSYNCLPGWGAAAPMRQVLALHDRLAPSGLSAETRTAQALAFAEKLFAAKPLYLATAPGTDKRLENLKKQSPRYIAHEYLNRDWDLMYFTDVADALDRARLRFAASANPLDNLPDLGMTAEAVAFLNSVGNPTLREQMRDYFVNRQFRKDIFTRGNPGLTQPEWLNAMLEERIILLRSREDITLECAAGMGKPGLNPKLFGPILERLEEGDRAPKSLRELTEGVAGEGLSPRDVISAAVILVGAGSAAPCQAPEMIEKCALPARALNREICRLARTRGDVGFLASPVIGGGVPLGRIGQLMLAAHAAGEDVPAAVREIVEKSGDRIMNEGQTIDDPAQALQHLEEAWSRFRERTLPVLQALGCAPRVRKESIRRKK